jgi:hypothetical protein
LGLALTIGGLIAVVSFMGNTIDKSYGVLTINEYMTRNTSVFPDENGQFHDWVEIHNANEEDISLDGWTLSDSADNLERWKFDTGTVIKGGGYLVIHCSGLEKVGHANFKLSANSNNEKLFLVNPAGNVVDSIPLHDTLYGSSFGRYGSTTGFFERPTPGAENNEAPVSDVEKISWERPTVRINEYSPRNNFLVSDEEGNSNGWVELYNYGTTPVDLTGMHLSDNPNRLDKWQFPEDSVIAAGEYKILNLSNNGNPQNLSFSLSSSDEFLILSNQDRRVIDTVPVIMVPSHASYGRCSDNPENWLFFPFPTPGAGNTSKGYDTIEGLSLLEWRGVYVQEVTLDNRLTLHNSTNQDVNLEGWVIARTTDGGSSLIKENLSGVISAGSSVNINLTKVTMRVNGRNLFLFDETGTIRDAFRTGELRGAFIPHDTKRGELVLRSEVSSGRKLNATTDCRYFFMFSTGLSVPFSGYSEAPAFSDSNTYANIGETVALTSNADNAVIRYTLDGSAPTEASPVYSIPIAILEDTVISARVYQAGLIPSSVAVRTYITEKTHTISKVMITSDPDGLFSHQTGMLAKGPGWRENDFPFTGANFWQRWERPAHFAFYDENGELQTEAHAGIRVFGQFSRAIDQKSIAVFFRNRYGDNTLEFPMFPGNDVTSFGSLVLRNSGQDHNITKLKDAFIHKAVQDVTAVDIQDARPVAVYINGEYWGLYNIREKINRHMYYHRYGIPTDEIDVIKANRRADEGCNTEYTEFVEVMRTLNINTEAGYRYAVDNIDLDSWMDWWIVQTYMGNTDTGNIRAFKQRGNNPDGTPRKWRWQLFDLDWALWNSTYEQNSLSRMLDPVGHGVGRNFNTIIARKLMEHEGIRNQFIERYAYHINNNFTPERLIGIMDDYADQIRHEMQFNTMKWGEFGSDPVRAMENWERRLETMRRILREKPDLMKGHLKSTFNISSARMAELFP